MENCDQDNSSVYVQPTRLSWREKLGDELVTMQKDQFQLNP